MIVLPLETWVSLASLLAVGLGLFAQGRATRAELKTDIRDVRGEVSQLRTELKQDMVELRTEFKQDMVELRTELNQGMVELRAELAVVEGRLTQTIQRVDDRVYALAAGLKPEVERAQELRRGA